MSDVTIKQLDEVPAYSGPGSIPGIQFRPTGRALGVTAWGMNVIHIEPGCEKYPEHDHQKDGQEEVYVVVRGNAKLLAEGREWPLEVGALVRVGPQTRRKFLPGPQGVTLLAIGSTPGKAYEPRR